MIPTQKVHEEQGEHAGRTMGKRNSSVGASILLFTFTMHSERERRMIYDVEQ